MLFRMHKILFTVSFVLLSLIEIKAQNTRYKLYNESTGLARHSIYDIEKGPRFYWLGTEKGLIRFDGSHFVEVNPPAPYTYEQIQDLYIYDHYLYIIYLREGCVRLDLKDYSFSVITNMSLSGIIQKDDKNIIFTDKKGNMYTYNGVRTQQIFSSQAAFDKHPMLIARDKLFVHFFKKGLHVFDLKNFKLIKNLGGDTLENHMNFNYKDDRILFVANGVVHEISKDLKLNKINYLQGQNKDITFLSKTSTGETFIIDRNALLYKVNKGKMEQILLPNLENVELKKILAHDENNILVSTNVGMVHIQTIQSPITKLSDRSIHIPNELRIRRKIIPIDNEDYLLFGYSKNYRYRNGTFDALNMIQSSSYDALKIGNDVYFTTEDKGLFTYNIKSEKIETVEALKQSVSPSLYSIAFDNHDSILIVGSKKNLYSYSLKTKKVTRYSLPIPNDYIQTLLYDSTNKRYWVGTDSGLVCLNKKFRPVNIISRTADNTKILDVTELLIHSKTKNLWIAHRYGVEIRDATKFTTVKNLSESFFENPVIAGLIEDKEGRVWMPTYEGLYAYEPQVDARLILGSKNDLINKEYNLKSFGMLPNGKLIFGGISGYDIVDPSKFNFNRSSDIGVITGYERILPNSSSLHILDDKLSSIQFNIDKESIRIYLSARNDLDSRTHRYEYQFNNEGWISMKDASFLNIYKLDPGLYKLQFRGYDEYGTLITFKPLYLNATVIFYKNRYFIWALFLFSIALIILVVINEVRRKRRENLLKEHISMDLHDEVGTILTRALMVSQASGIPQKEEKVTSYLSEALFSLRVYINTMNKHSFSLYQLSDELKELMSKSFPENEYNVHVSIKIDTGTEISSEKYRDMKLCMFEIMNNILKHSNAKNITVELTATPLLIRFQIIDDGILTDIGLLEEKGNGIRNIRKRVKKHKGLSDFSISEKEHGLQVTLICPQ